MAALAPILPRHRFALLLLAVTTPVAAETQRYALDPVHTRVLFAVSHAGFSRALGTVSGSTGILEFDAGDWSSARLSATVPLARLDLGDPQWNAAVLANRLLDTDDHPEARFVSTLVTARDAQHAQVCGDLTLRGVTAPLCMEVTLNAQKRHPLPPFRRTVGFSATATLSRSAFGIDAWKSVIGDDVELRIEAEATRRNADDGAADDAVDGDSAHSRSDVDPNDTEDPGIDTDEGTAPTPPEPAAGLPATPRRP